MPKLVFVSMMDKDGADFDHVYDELKTKLSDRMVPVEIPIGVGEDFRGIVNLVSGHAHLFKSGTQTGEYDRAEVPDEVKESYDRYRTDLIETIAATDEGLMERYLEGQDISREDVLVAFKKAVLAREVFPVFCGVAPKTLGTRALLNKIVEIFPHPDEMEGDLAETLKGEPVELRQVDSDPLAALVFKTTSEPHVGELSYFKVMAGVIENAAELENATDEKNEKLAHLSVAQGATRLEVDRLHAGDIGVVARLKHTHTGDTLTDPSRPLRIEPPAFPEPESRLAIKVVRQADDDKLGLALARLHEEDPCFQHTFDAEVGETVVSGLGELHLEVALEKLRERHGIEVESSPPHVHYRETLAGEAKSRGRYKKQTGGRGQFGDCHLVVRPRPRGEGYAFHNKIVGGAIPGKYIPAVDKGVQEAAARGLISGFPVIDFEVECVDGSYHAVDSSEMAFKVAGSMAFREAAETAGVQLLEPLMKVIVVIPNESTGDVMGDISQRRGRILGMDTQKTRTVIEAVVPEGELYRYASALRSMTAGRGHHNRQPMGYEIVPENLVEGIIAAQQQDQAEG